ncbi:hypothetical protein [Pseudomonas sp. KBS0710]|uniref:hypothetical protein n=1 Tax=Pseudomonas sp. KBS0710 TaxID=1179667 RepID=UPI0015B6CED4|nr:hypothetical protein [Pseudomonas sp. KBS0710]
MGACAPQKLAIYCVSKALQDGRQFTLTAGISYPMGNDMEGHRSSTRSDAKLFIVD